MSEHQTVSWHISPRLALEGSMSTRNTRWTARALTSGAAGRECLNPARCKSGHCETSLETTLRPLLNKGCQGNRNMKKPTRCYLAAPDRGLADARGTAHAIACLLLLLASGSVEAQTFNANFPTPAEDSGAPSTRALDNAVGEETIDPFTGALKLVGAEGFEPPTLAL